MEYNIIYLSFGKRDQENFIVSNRFEILEMSFIIKIYFTFWGFLR